MTSVVYYSDSLYHHGILGQKWGRRRYQNEDGSYKPGAEGRYYDEVSDRKGLRKVFKKKSSADVEEAVKKEKQLNELERMRAQNARYRAETEAIVNEYKGQTVKEVIQGKPEEKKKGMSFAKKAIIGGALIAGGVILYKKFGGSVGNVSAKVNTEAIKDTVKETAKKGAKGAANIAKETAKGAAASTAKDVSKDAMQRLIERTSGNKSDSEKKNPTTITEKANMLKEDKPKKIDKEASKAAMDALIKRTSGTGKSSADKNSSKTVEEVSDKVDDGLEFMTRYLMGFAG